MLCLLLSVPQIQRDLLKFVLDTLYERALGDENSASVTYGVIQALKWQDTINDPEASIRSLLQCPLKLAQNLKLILIIYQFSQPFV